MRSFSSILTLIAVAVTLNGCSGCGKESETEKNAKVVAKFLLSGNPTPDEKQKKAIEALKDCDEKDIAKVFEAYVAKHLSVKENFNKAVTEKKYEEYTKDSKVKDAVNKQKAAEMMNALKLNNKPETPAGPQAEKKEEDGV